MWPESLSSAPFYPFVPPMRRVEPVMRVQPQNPDKRVLTKLFGDQTGTLIIYA